MPTILVLDDSAQARAQTTKLLQQEGYQALPVSTGEQAFLTLESQRVDLVLLDLNIPGMDGLTFLQLLRGDPRWDQVSVVVLTSLSDGVSFRHARRFGADKFLVKGQVTPSALLGHIQRRLGIFDTGDKSRGMFEK